MNEKQLAGEKAVEFITDGMTVGLGTGSTVYFTIMKLGELVRTGLRITAVSTSEKTTKLAEAQGIKISDLNEVQKVDLTIDGADEVDRDFNGIKGGGGALLYEKIVALNSEKVIWVIDSSKLVHQLGKFPLPVEVVQFGCQKTFDRFTALGFNPVFRMDKQFPFSTDAGNYIIDLQLGKIENAMKLEQIINSIPGVVECGLFIGMTNTIIVGRNGDVEIILK
ncbi:MAG TPA: ribose-5-phosphate isomerase RpiA [Ignavibacteriaceae bacterium]|nr:ribose-5-phosphate isomerase RpiA [Ignavibacteriaceae bacterium]